MKNDTIKLLKDAIEDINLQEVKAHDSDETLDSWMRSWRGMMKSLLMSLERSEETEDTDDVPETPKNSLSVANIIKALALINIQDIFRFMITAKDSAIEECYGSESEAIEVAEKYLEIAMHADLLELPIHGWSMKYSKPISDSDERREFTARFYDKQNEVQTND